MSNKENMQNSELNAVSGGGLYNLPSDPIRCLRCNTWFVRMNRPSRNVKEGCSRYTVYQCPTCGDWLANDGTVHNG